MSQIGFSVGGPAVGAMNKRTWRFLDLRRFEIVFAALPVERIIVVVHSIGRNNVRIGAFHRGETAIRRRTPADTGLAAFENSSYIVDCLRAAVEMVQTDNKRSKAQIDNPRSEYGLSRLDVVVIEIAYIEQRITAGLFQVAGTGDTACLRGGLP